MLSKTFCFGLRGIDGFPVTVEVNISKGDYRLELVGLADTSVKESVERIKSAIINSFMRFPLNHITINLAPADKKKEGPAFDLPIAVGLLAASSQVSIEAAKSFVILGELSLSGDVRKVTGLLPTLISALKAGYKKFIIPKENEIEAAFIEGIQVYAVENLIQAVNFLNGNELLQPVTTRKYDVFLNTPIVTSFDFKNIKGQRSAKRALEIAAAGGHNVLMIGPPGTGKTLLAKSFASILPEMTFDEALDVTKIHSVAGELDLKQGIIISRPVRTPHHSASLPSLTGGGSNARPGEISLAHNGVLFLDEMPEYERRTLETLRQPLEDGTITVARSKQTITYPANFILVASMNPCPCGYYGSKVKKCTCTPMQIHKYLGKLSGPLMDRIDLHVEVDNITYEEMTGEVEAESSEQIRNRVNASRKIQQERFKSKTQHCNSEMNPVQTKKYCKLDEFSEAIIRQAFDTLSLSARAYDKILKVARTIADLEGCELITTSHLAEALQYRTLDQKYWA